MATFDNLGYAAAIGARREVILATAPRSARMRILGRRPAWTPVKSHRIEVDLKTGTRMVERDVVVHLPTPQTVNPFVAVVERPLHCADILDAVATAWGVEVGHIQGKSQKWIFAHPRFAVVRLIRQRLDWSYPRIGKLLVRDHSTILASLHRAEELYAHDAAWHEKYDAAVATLDGGAS